MEMVMMDDFEQRLTELCEQEAATEEQTLDEVLAAHAQELKNKLTERSPKDTREYARGWRVRTATVNHETVKIIYNALRPDLTFMLEYGTHNKDGSVRMEARQHIRTTLNEEIDQIMDELLARL
ncbi:MAG: HK97 gp10 family phage protein [Flavonifractor plautii]|nr:HK97 gp10 family phage protein [Flavonifractor plautii]